MVCVRFRRLSPVRQYFSHHSQSSPPRSLSTPRALTPHRSALKDLPAERVGVDTNRSSRARLAVDSVRAGRPAAGARSCAGRGIDRSATTPRPIAAVAGDCARYLADRCTARRPQPMGGGLENGWERERRSDKKILSYPPVDTVNNVRQTDTFTNRSATPWMNEGLPPSLAA